MLVILAFDIFHPTDHIDQMPDQSAQGETRPLDVERGSLDQSVLAWDVLRHSCLIVSGYKMSANQENPYGDPPVLAAGLYHLTVVHNQICVLIVREVIELLRRPFQGVQIKDLHLLFDIVKSVELGGHRYPHQVEVLGDHTVVEHARYLLEGDRLLVI